MRAVLSLLITVPLILTASAAWSNMSVTRQSAASRAASEYKAGQRDASKADELQAQIARVSDPGKQQRLHDRAQAAYARALQEFLDATHDSPEMAEAWNGLGYASRNLGRYQDALSAYERALALRPDYPDAIEYRGEAFLGADRIADAKGAYLELFAGNRTLAARLLGAMQQWAEARRHDGRIDPASIHDLEQWVAERARIASETAALTREGTAAAWK